MHAYIRSSSEGNLPFTSPTIFCLSGGTSVRLMRAAFKSNTLFARLICHLLRSAPCGTCQILRCSSHKVFHSK